jgi:hypothetical protein
MSKPNNRVIPVSVIVGFFSLFAVIVAIAIAKKTAAIDYDFAKRGVGIVLGLMLIGVGNLIPKFRLFDSPRRDPAKTCAAERFAGWVFVLAGAAYVAVWAFAPMSGVMLISSILGLAAFALVAFDWLRRVRNAEARTARPQPTEATLVKRFLLGTILLTLGWGVAIFLVDHVWGDAASLWVGIIYSIVVPFLALGPVQMLASRSRSDN